MILSSISPGSFAPLGSVPDWVTRRFGTTDTSDIRERANAMYPQGFTLSFSADEIACVCDALTSHANACANASAYAENTMAVDLRIRILWKFLIEEQ